MTDVCARCAGTQAEHPGGYCPDVVGTDGQVEVGETRIFQPAENGEWDGEEAPEETGSMAVVPLTGEVVDLSNPAEVARAFETVDEVARLAAEAKRLLNGALVDYSERRGERTFSIPGYGKFERTGGPQKEYDPAAVKQGLLDAGMPADRVSEIVVETVDRKVNGREAQKAARSNDRYREVIEGAARTVEKPYRVTRKG